MSRRVAILTALIIVGAIFLISSINIGATIGATWFGEQASFPWRMNNYIIIEAKYAYAIFGLGIMAIGGLATGLAMPAFFAFTKSKKHKLALASSFFVAILLTGLGFNTLDFMLGCFYWTNMTYPPPVQVALLGPVDVWNYYFFFFVFPLWFGGFLIGLASSYYTFAYQAKQTTAGYIAKKTLPGLLGPARQAKEYSVE